eukprot:jgi/Phyca11/507158/fgenesh2_kg.PHYCAscaffold_25_\
MRKSIEEEVSKLRGEEGDGVVATDTWRASHRDNRRRKALPVTLSRVLRFSARDN